MYNRLIPFLVALIFSSNLLGIEHVQRTGNGKYFYLSKNSEIIEANVSADGEISNPEVRDASWQIEKIVKMLPYGEERVVLYTTKRRSPSVKKVYIKETLSAKEQSIASEQERQRIFSDGADFKDMAIVGSNLYFLTTRALWVKSLATLQNWDEVALKGIDITAVQKIIGVGNYLVAYTQDERIISFDGNNVKIIGTDWKAPFDMARFDDESFIVKSGNNIFLKFAAKMRNPRKQGNFSQGMTLPSRFQLYDKDGLFLVDYFKTTKSPEPDSKIDLEATDYLSNLVPYVKQHNPLLMPDTRSYHLKNLRVWWEKHADTLEQQKLTADDTRRLEQIVLATIIKMYDEGEHNFALMLRAKNSRDLVKFGDAILPARSTLLFGGDITISENHIAHIKDQFGNEITGLSPGDYTFSVFVSERSVVTDEVKPNYFNVFPLILHEGTRKFANQLVLEKPRTPKFHEMFNKLDGYFRGFSHYEKSQFIFFGSMTLGVYNLFVGTKFEQRRPRDIDGWYVERNAALRKKLLESKAKLDIYGIEASWVTAMGNKQDRVNMSMIDRYFGYYQALANAEVGIKYVVHPHNAPIGNGVFTANLPKQKFPTVDFKEESVATLHELYDVSDLFSDDRNSFFYNGFRFLGFELEVFRKHLRFMDNCLVANVKTFSCNTRLENKDAHDLNWMATLIRQGKIRPPRQFGEGMEGIERYLNYLAVDGNTDIPINQIQILASVPMDTNVALKQNKDPSALPIIIRSPMGLSDELAVIIKNLQIPTSTTQDVMNKKKALVGQVEFVRLSEKQILGDVPSENSQAKFNKSAVAERIGKGDMASATFRSDLRSGYDFLQQKLFRDPLISSLPKSPVKSIFGDVPSGWTYVLDNNGKFHVLLTTSGFELGSKHLFLLEPGTSAVAAGEMLVLSDGTIVYNLLSGTFMKKLFRSNREKYTQVKNLVEYILVRHALADPDQQYPLVAFSDQLLIPYRARPHFGEIALMCTMHRFENRLFSKIDNKFNRYYINTTDFFAGIKRTTDNVNLCDTLLNHPNDSWTESMQRAISPADYLRFDASYVSPTERVNDAILRKAKLEQRLLELEQLLNIRK